MMPTIPLSRSKHIQPFAALLKKAGEPVGRALLKAGLPGGCLEHSETVISADAVFRFREHCGLVLGRDDIALDATRELQFEKLGEFGRALFAAPTLSRLLTTFRDFLNTQTSITEIELKRLESGDVAFCYRFNHLPEVGVWHSDLYTFQWAIKIIRLAIPTWAPVKVWSVSSHSSNRQEVFQQLGVNQAEFQRNCTGFLIRSSVLALPLTRNLADGDQVDESLLQTARLPETDTQVIRKVIQSYTSDRWLSIVETGDVLGMSVLPSASVSSSRILRRSVPNSVASCGDLGCGGVVVRG
jgi:hypothetical protein